MCIFYNLAIINVGCAVVPLRAIPVFPVYLKYFRISSISDKIIYIDGKVRCRENSAKCGTDFSLLPRIHSLNFGKIL